MRSFALWESEDGTRDPDAGLVGVKLQIESSVPALLPLFATYPAAVPLPDIESGVGDAPDESLFAFCSPALT